MADAPPPAPFDPAQLAQDLPFGVFHARGTLIDWANPRVGQLLGCAPDWVLGRSVFELLGPTDQQVVQARYQARRRGEAGLPDRYEVDVRRHDGSFVRLEVEPHLVGDEELVVLVRDVSARVRDTGILPSLAEIALRVQRCRQVDAVLQVAGAGLTALGVHFVVARLDGKNLVFEHAQFAGPRGAEVEARMGRPLRGSVVPEQAVLARAGELRAGVLFMESALPAFEAMLGPVLPDVPPAELGRLLGAAGFGRAVLCPLVVDGRSWGLLGAAAGSFTFADAAALGLFASQVASAIESCRTIARLEERNRELAAVQEVAAAGSEPSLERLLQQLLHIAARSLGAEAVAVYLLDEKRSSLNLAAADDKARAVAGHFQSFLLEIAAVAQTFVQLKAVAIDVARDLPPSVRLVLLDGGVGQVAVVPLHIKSRLAGALALGRPAWHPFSNEELRAAEFLCDQMAIQVENARLYADASRRLRQLSTLFDLSQIGTATLDSKTLVDRVLQQAVSALAVDSAAIHILEGGRLQRAGQFGWGPAPVDGGPDLPCDASSLPGRAVLDRRTVFADGDYWRDHPEHATGAAVVAVAPLISKDRTLGALTVARQQDERFEEEERRLLEAFAAQVGAALEQARLFEDERRRVEELKLFVEVGRVVTASLDLDQILEASAVSLARIAGATDCFILLLDQARRVLRGSAASSPEFREPFRSLRLPLESRSVAAQAVLTRLPVRVSDLARESVPRTEMLERFGQRSLLALPLAVRDEAIGAVLIGDSRGARDWTDAQIERATVVARQVAVAVANARLYEDLKRSYDQLARTQEELVKRERLAALGELAAVVAHEVRNPLGVIFNSLRSLGRVLKPSGDAAMLLDIVGEEADRLNRIVGDLLDFARPSEPSLQPEPLEAVLGSVVEGAVSAAAANGVKIEVRATEPLPKAAVDARMLRQALLNLVINAVQAMPRGGTVILVAAEERTNGLPVVRIDISDTGPGIPPELADRVFQPFFTTKAAGTGLGLAVVKRIVEAHRGEVSLEAPAGKGAHFTLRLPLDPRPPGRG